MSTAKNFSLWVDYLERDFIKSDLGAMIAKGSVRGATSNPAIFKNAFTTSKAYEAQKSASVSKGKELYEELAIKDIQDACDSFLPIYKENHNDGFVSLEVDPALCDDAEKTVAEGLSLAKRINRENLMIKVPATQAGYQAIENLLAQGVHVNATLIFSNKQTLKVLEAYKRANSEKNLVISVFISRFDRALDKKLPSELQGKAGVYNGAECYNSVEQENLANVRTLFASTGVKGDAYPPSYYVDELIGDNSINTAPLQTIEAFLAQGTLAKKLPISQKEIESYFSKIAELGINFESVSDTLLQDGLEQFKVAFQEILDSLK